MKHTTKVPVTYKVTTDFGDGFKTIKYFPTKEWISKDGGLEDVLEDVSDKNIYLTSIETESCLGAYGIELRFSDGMKQWDVLPCLHPSVLTYNFQKTCELWDKFIPAKRRND